MIILGFYAALRTRLHPIWATLEKHNFVLQRLLTMYNWESRRCEKCLPPHSFILISIFFIGFRMSFVSKSPAYFILSNPTALCPNIFRGSFFLFQHHHGHWEVQQGRAQARRVPRRLWGSGLFFTKLKTAYNRSRIHERTISLRFLGIILRVLRHEVSVYKPI
jgi:hypothetical protein